MAVETFDVYVEGSKEKTASGLAALATAIAARYKMPPDAVAGAVSKGRFRVGKALDGPTAGRLAKQLEDLGAITLTHPTGAALPAARPAPADLTWGTAPTQLAPASAIVSSLHPDTQVDRPGARPDRRTMLGVEAPPRSADAWVPATGVAEPTAPGRPAPAPRSSGGMPSAASIRLGFVDGQAGDAAGYATPSATGAGGAPGGLGLANPFGASLGPTPGLPTPGPGATGAARNPFGPATGEVPLELGGPSPAVQHSPFPPALDGGGLELDLPQPRIPSADTRTSGPAPTVDPAPGPSARPSAGARQFINDPDLPEGNPNIIRCQQHGLMYDRTKTDGCRKCLEPFRQTAALPDRKPPIVTLADLKHNEIKRALVGLGVALLLGFFPTAWYVFSVNEGEVLRLRAEQAEISKRPGTEDVRREFDKIDEEVDRTRGRGMWKAFFLWTAAAGSAMAGFYKATDKLIA